MKTFSVVVSILLMSLVFTALVGAVWYSDHRLKFILTSVVLVFAASFFASLGSDDK